ncbi:protein MICRORCHIDIA 1-like isoform X2 [Lotus japonicus]|uniref:protein MICRORCHIDIA 1-like isoform X2 n=1 Tax=Lotus japonicus TaxID=34305 RepID=UPI002588C8CE|nr:protein MICRORCHIDIA 1-like isoform X2 [Lotus japonicus]
MSLIPKTEKDDDVPVVDLDSTENSAVAAVEVNDAAAPPVAAAPIQVEPPLPKNTPASNSAPVYSRSFWKAGDYVVGPSVKPASDQGYLEHARVHPKFLHSNATSHKWAFGAIAELVDNAVDEIQNGATFVKVDKIDNMKDNSPVLCFQDDGGGMDPNSIRKCMSLGYSSKKSKTTIGQYGNGFKTSTMRLGADAIVFSRAVNSSRATQSVGLLSYTFLRTTGQDDVIVPMIDFDISTHWAEPIIYSSQDDWSDNLKTILDWSPFSSKEELMLQFDDIGSHGTKILIYNLWLNDEGIYELSFDDDAEDIMLRDETNHGDEKKLSKKTVQLQSHISYRIRHSLRAMVDTTIGFIKEAPNLNVAGFNVYHKNRLIKPFWKVNPDGSSRGSGVVGVLEANFIEPAHDKQDFERSLLFVRLETKLKQMVNDYWKGHCHLVGYQPLNFKSQNVQKETQIRQSAGRSTNTQNVHQDDLYIDQTIAGATSTGTPGPVAVDKNKICEENIQLFMKCEEFRKKETELKQTVENLEEDLKDLQRKCRQLSAFLVAKKKQKSSS